MEIVEENTEERRAETVHPMPHSPFGTRLVGARRRDLYLVGRRVGLLLAAPWLRAVALRGSLKPIADRPSTLRACLQQRAQ